PIKPAALENLEAIPHLAIKFAAAARPAAPIPSTQSQLGSEFKSYGLDAGGS
ncbi:hypothetical protein E4U34_008072, partial [Claviceps purpurea]